MYLEKGKFYGGNGIVGAQIPLGAGLAFAHKFRKDGGVAVAAMGDGASNQGQVRRRDTKMRNSRSPFLFLLFFSSICCTIVKHSR
jgi:pyruvate dehydrogenase E1 component alpha subunit